MTKPHFLTLDAMRGVAAITVVLFHGARLAGVQTMPHGYLAVDMFFALSGFVISRAYDRRLAAEWTPLHFFRLRLVRFYPLYALGLAIGATRELLLVATHNHFALPVPLLFGALAAGALFLPFPVGQRGDYLFAMNPPAWSLFYELLVNIGYALVFRWLTVRTLVAIALAGLAAIWVLGIHAGTLELGGTGAQWPGGAARTIFGFSVGVLINRLDIRTRAVPPWLLLALVVAIGASPAHWGVAFDLAIVTVVVPVMIAAGASATVGARQRGLFAFLGAISFPIYAIHGPLLPIAEMAAQRLPGVPRPALLAALVAALLVAAWLLELLYDAPLRRRLRHVAMPGVTPSARTTSSG